MSHAIILFFKCFHVRCALGVEGGHLSEGLRASQVLLVFDCWLPGQQRSAGKQKMVHKASRERYPNPLLHRIPARRVASHRIISAPGLTKTHCPTDRSHGVRHRRWRCETLCLSTAKCHGTSRVLGTCPSSFPGLHPGQTTRARGWAGRGREGRSDCHARAPAQGGGWHQLCVHIIITKA